MLGVGWGWGQESTENQHSLAAAGIDLASKRLLMASMKRVRFSQCQVCVKNGIRRGAWVAQWVRPVPLAWLMVPGS